MKTAIVIVRPRWTDKFKTLEMTISPEAAAVRPLLPTLEDEAEDERRAKARRDLAAAAPALLEALTMALTWAEEQRTIEHARPDNEANQCLMDDVCSTARAAIAKAGGRP